MPMQVPLEITENNLSLSQESRNRIEEKAAWLLQYYDRITACHVVAEAQHRHKAKGGSCNVRIELFVPGAVISVTHQSAEDIDVAIRDAFDAARRQLEDYARKRRHQVKEHHRQPHGQVIRIFPEKGYGFLEDSDGREIYFHRNSILDGDFERLKIGTEVQFAEEEGNEGLQATMVKLKGQP